MVRRSLNIAAISKGPILTITMSHGNKKELHSSVLGLSSDSPECTIIVGCKVAINARPALMEKCAEYE